MRLNQTVEFFKTTCQKIHSSSEALKTKLAAIDKKIKDNEIKLIASAAALDIYHNLTTSPTLFRSQPLSSIEAIAIIFAVGATGYATFVTCEAFTQWTEKLLTKLGNQILDKVADSLAPNIDFPSLT